MPKEVVGQIKNAKGEMQIEWEIDAFLSLSAEVDRCYDSPMYFFCDSSWYLQVFPNGQHKYSSEGYTGVYLRRGDSGPPVSLTYSLFVKTTDGREVILEASKSTFSEKDKGWGSSRAIWRSKLVEQNSRLMSSGTLTIISSLKWDEIREIRDNVALIRDIKDCIPSTEVCTETDVCVGTVKLLSDLKSLAVSGEESDMTVRVGNEEFRLHRAIMAARTPVFNAMLKLNMKEKATGIVSVEDCDAEIFRAFVHYLYTGSEDEICSENVVRVYKTADKYQVEELKASCLGIMKSTLSIDTFCDTLALAIQHEEKELIDQATVFLSEKGSDIICREDWLNLMRSCMKPVSELLQQAWVRNSKKLADAVKK